MLGRGWRRGVEGDWNGVRIYRARSHEAQGCKVFEGFEGEVSIKK
jgi:hypothetical protein